MLDWARIQRALARAAYDPDPPTSPPGARTFTALFALAASRRPDATIESLGNAATRQLATDPVAATALRLAEFLAQCAVNTGQFQRFEERFDYSAQGLADTWPQFSRTGKRYGAPNALARSLAHDPAGIARAVFAFADPAPGGVSKAKAEEAWRYRPRGMLPMAGEQAYAHYASALDLPLLERPELAAEPITALTLALAVWRDKGVNRAVDRADFRAALQLASGTDLANLGAVAARRVRLLQILS